MNCFRSAIGKILGSSLADDSRIKGFFKGVFRLKPPKAKYDCTWNPKIVLDYLGKLNSNDDLSLDELSKKLVTLLALVTGHRMQTLSLIDIRNIMINDDKFEIKIPENIKTSKLGKVQPNLVIPFFVKNLSICPASALSSYLKKTKILRNEENKLFIAIKKPHKAVGSQTLSRWIKSFLCDSGLDTSKFGAYSIRHASTSAVKRSGINIDLILKTAGWTKKSQTFARFYNRPVITDDKSYALAILNQSS